MGNFKWAYEGARVLMEDECLKFVNKGWAAAPARMRRVSNNAIDVDLENHWGDIGTIRVIKKGASQYFSRLVSHFDGGIREQMEYSEEVDE